MKRNYYIFTNTIIRRKDNTICFETGDWESLKSSDEKNIADLDKTEHSNEIDKFKNDQEELLISYDIKDKFDDGASKKFIPIEDVDSLFVFGEVKFNSRFLNFLSTQKIPLHLFNYYGFYSGSFYPSEYLNSGKVLVSQVNHYNNNSKRMNIATEILNASVYNIQKNLSYYCNRGVDLELEISDINKLRISMAGVKNIPELMGLEGNIRQIYYSCWNKILKTEETFDKRVKQPPDNIVNALISFGNMLMYSACLSEIYRTQLNPLISFLHEPGERRFSLSLDLSEIFKPIFVDRIIFKLINQKMLNEKDFDKNLNYCYLKESGKKIFVKEFEDKLKTVIKHKTLNRNVSYKRIIRLECYKLIKHLLEDKKYESFKIWW